MRMTLARSNVRPPGAAADEVLERRHPTVGVGDADADVVDRAVDDQRVAAGEDVAACRPPGSRSQARVGHVAGGPVDEGARGRAGPRVDVGLRRPSSRWASSRRSRRAGCGRRRSATRSRSRPRLEDHAVGAEGVPGLRRGERRVARGVVDRQHRVEDERELDQPHDQRHEDREDQGELDQGLARLAARARIWGVGRPGAKATDQERHSGDHLRVARSSSDASAGYERSPCIRHYRLVTVGRTMVPADSPARRCQAATHKASRHPREALCHPGRAEGPGVSCRCSDRR